MFSHHVHKQVDKGIWEELGRRKKAKVEQVVGKNKNIT